MIKTMTSLAAGAALMALTLPGPASAADSKRADGLTNEGPRATEFSSRHRRWHRPRAWRRYYRHGYRYRPYYRDYYAYAPYPYYSRPYYYRRPGVYFGGPGFAFGFGW